MYKVVWSLNSQKDLERIDKGRRAQIIKKVETYFCINPDYFGKPLDGQFLGSYRFRLGDYRIIYKIHREEIFITILNVDHRKDIYKRM